MATILVIDDEISVYMSIKLTLADHKVIFGNSGRDGVEQFKKEHPDLIFLDLKMPDMDGEEALRIIRRHDKKVPVIVLTAYPGDMLSHEEEFEISALMIKPFDVNELRDEVRRALGEKT